MVTAETAMALPALVVVLGFALTVQSVLGTRASCGEAARAAARAAARGEPDAVVIETARRVLPRAGDVSVRRDDGLVTVSVRARPGTVVPLITTPEVVGEAVASDESAPAGRDDGTVDLSTGALPAGALPPGALFTGALGDGEAS